MNLCAVSIISIIYSFSTPVEENHINRFNIFNRYSIDLCILEKQK